MAAPQAWREWADRDAIARVLIDYCDALDRMELERIAALFTPDAVVAYGPAEHLCTTGGGEAVAAALARLWRFTRTSHHLSNIAIDFDGPDRADARSYVIAWHERPDGSTATLYGQYADRLVRSGGRWLIASRTQFMNGSDEGFKVALHPLSRRPAPPGWTAPEGIETKR